MDESPEAHGHPYTAADPLQIGPHICKFSDEICNHISWFSVFNIWTNQRGEQLYTI